MKYNFKLRIYKPEKRYPVLTDISEITLSNITLLSKGNKYEGLCWYNGNKKKFGYSIELSKPLNKIGGSHRHPAISWEGDYIEIIIKDFPRYPCFSQDKYIGRNAMNGNTINAINNGYPIWLEYRKVEIIEN